MASNNDKSGMGNTSKDDKKRNPHQSDDFSGV